MFWHLNWDDSQLGLSWVHELDPKYRPALHVAWDFNSAMAVLRGSKDRLTGKIRLQEKLGGCKPS